MDMVSIFSIKIVEKYSIKSQNLRAAAFLENPDPQSEYT